MEMPRIRLHQTEKDMTRNTIRKQNYRGKKHMEWKINWIFRK